MSGRYCTFCGEMDYSDNGDMPCLCGSDADFGAWSLEDKEDAYRRQCAEEGHQYHGDDENGGRCYCGYERFPAGNK